MGEKIEEDQQEQTRDLEHDCTALLTKGGAAREGEQSRREGERACRREIERGRNDGGKRGRKRARRGGKEGEREMDECGRLRGKKMKKGAHAKEEPRCVFFSENGER